MGNIDVTWSISPAGAGSIDGTGFYTAPAAIPAQQTVIITATSQTNPAVTASATISLAPAQCISNGYSYMRAITIDHTKIPNTDQANFPFLFSSTDPLLATAANGGHVTSPNGYDIIFSSDLAGKNVLNYEMEVYNPTTGQITAWVSIPTLSHAADTVIYLFYGNPSITASQQNSTGVWDSNYSAVYHLQNTPLGISVADSTANGNNGIAGNNGITLPAAATGVFGTGAGSFNGSQGIYLPSFSLSAFSVSAWILPAASGHTGAFFAGSPGAMEVRIRSDNTLDLLDEDVVDIGASSSPVNINAWNHVVISYDGSTANFYINGVPSGSSVNSQTFSSGNYFLGEAGNGENFIGNIDELQLSTSLLSADWIATEYNNQSSPSTFYAFSTESTTGIAPAMVTLYANQSQQFTAPGLCSTGVTWSLSSDTEGTLTPSGFYIAPSAITQQQTVTVTATRQGNSGQAVSATVTLLPPVSVTVSPASVTLNENQTQQFAATVNNSLSQTVTWTMSPAGLGSLDQNGGYIAPSSILTQQTVTITATSQTDPAKSASAMITLAPSVCASTGYGYQRVIVIDHTKVANTDQINYPFLFNSIDPDLATVDNGGHVINPNGSDILFSSDPNGRTRLDFEVEQYNPATGQLVAWIRIPTLSHSADTVIYVFYGNPAITASQANPSGVWDSNYEAVYHLGNLPSTEVASDSTSYANNASFTNLAPVSGLIDGSASLDGTTSYLEIPAAAFPNYPQGVYNNIGINTTWNNTGFDATFGIWFKTASWGPLLDQTSGYSCGWLCLFPVPEQPGTDPGSSWIGSSGMLSVNFNGNLSSNFVGAPTRTYNDNKWHYATITFGNGVNNIYADGQLVATSSSASIGYSPNYAYFVGTEDIESDNSPLDSRPWRYLNGQIDEINVSNTARSGDWIQTQYNNQSSPSTFYTFYSPAAIQVAPSSISLYASQSEQFTVPGTCDATISWSLSSGSLGTLTSSGLYTAPSAISSQQTITVSATSQSSGSSLGSALVTLLTPPQPLTLIASSPSPYLVSSMQTFTATLLDPQGNPRIGVTVNFTVTGVNATLGSAVTSTNGTASFSYTGSNTGTDTVQATATVNGTVFTSNSLTVAWFTASPVSAPTVTLLPQPTLGLGALVGAFTDNSGEVIEPIAIGASAKTYIVPVGATQLQLGVDANYYELNEGAGFVVAVNGVNVTVPPTAQPWNWQTGGLNNNYQFGINDGSTPKVGAANLTAGQPVSVAYQSGTVATSTPIHPLVDANGETDFSTGAQVWQGAYFPTLYTTGTSYPQSQPINVFAVVTDATGTPIPNTPVTLSVAGANPGQYQAVSDATGTASFLYTGQYAGNDSLQAQAVLNGGGTLNSNQTTIDWTNYPTPPPVGSLSLNSIVAVVNSQDFTSVAKDASGNPLTNVNIGFYVTGVDTFQSSSSTDDIGHASFDYYHTQSGNYSIIAVDSVDRNVIVTPAYTGTWMVPVNGQSSSSSGDTITISISAASTVTMPNTLQLNGSATDSLGNPLTFAWSQVPGPGTVTFANPASPVTTASFSDLGSYVLQLTASDVLGTSASVQITVSVTPPLQDPQGWIGSPLYGSSVSGIVPITLAPNIAIQPGGILTYYPTNNSYDVTTLPITAESGTIGTLDTTMLQNGSYWIQLQATGADGEQQYSLVMVTVSGNYKPGRVTATVTDLVVPAAGLAINIRRTYDSLNAGTSGDFGYGWNLGINVNLVVDNLGNVTFTLGGQRKTFDLTPSRPPCTIVGCLFSYYYAAYTPEPGLHGTLTDGGSGCGATLEILVPDGVTWDCQASGLQFNPTQYIYTDPNGTSYTISAAGNLQSIVDRSGNGLAITASGITSTSGLSVPFVRDAQNRITQITDPQGNIYSYGYDANGNLVTVTYPTTPGAATCPGAPASNTSQYSYYPDTAHPNYPAHFYAGGTDGRCNPLPVTAYYDSATDGGNSSLDGRLLSTTDALNNTTSYAYNLATTTTTITYPDNSSATMVYDSYGDLLTSTDPLGNTTTNLYDANHNLISVTDPLGHVNSYTYDVNGNKTSSTYPATGLGHNTTSTTVYNQYSEPISTTDELGNTRTFNYDANYNPQSVTDSIGTLASFSFNPNGMPLAGATGFDIRTNPDMASLFSYDANGNMASSTDALGRQTSFTYDSLGRKLSITIPATDTSGISPAAAKTSRHMALTNLKAGSSSSESESTLTVNYVYGVFSSATEISGPLGRQYSYSYDANGNKISSTDPLGHVTTYKYDSLNRLIAVNYPTSPATSATWTYDFRNNIVDATNPDGHVTHYSYDLVGNLVAITHDQGTSKSSTTTFTYDAARRRISETDALGHTTSYTYDADNRVIAISGAKANVQYGYDDAGNLTSVTDANNNTTQFQYDGRKHRTKTIFPDSTFKAYVYDGPGNLISTTDQAGNIIQYTYDAANQLVSVIQVNHPNQSNNTNFYGYDTDKNLVSLTDENGNTTKNAFDIYSDPVSMILPDGSLTEMRQYDAIGNLISLTHFNGKTTTYTYDGLNRLLTRTPDPSLGESAISFTYNANGKFATSTDATGTTYYTYGSLGRLISKQTPEGTLNYTYDAVGRVTSIASSNPNGASVSYTYDDLNRLSTVVDNRLQGYNTTTYTYDSASNVATVTYPNGLQSTFNYDSLNRLTSMSTPVSNYSYQLDPTGNRTSATEGNGRSLTWNYDGIYRLTNETISADPDNVNGSVAYGLDPVGNRQSKSSTLNGIHSGTYSYNVDDEVLTETYDPNGNTLTIGAKAFTYDSENRLATMTSNSTAVSQVYDAFGNLVSKTVNGVTTRVSRRRRCQPHRPAAGDGRDRRRIGPARLHLRLAAH